VRRALLARVLVLGLALVACGWYVVGIRQAHAVAQASAIVFEGGHITAAQARRASDLLSSARFLNPDRQVDVLRAEVKLERGQLPGARRILKRVVMAEPNNARAWLTLARASVHDVRDFYAAAFAIHRLVPPVHAGH
jgi:uncharacterized protein HemY